jgi:hypothetical protein
LSIVERASEVKGSQAGNVAALCEFVANALNAFPILISALTPGFTCPTMVHRVMTKDATRREEGLDTRGG